MSLRRNVKRKKSKASSIQPRKEARTVFFCAAVKFMKRILRLARHGRPCETRRQSPRLDSPPWPHIRRLFKPDCAWPLAAGAERVHVAATGGSVGLRGRGRQHASTRPSRVHDNYCEITIFCFRK